jgi:hypothetical protein
VRRPLSAATDPASPPPPAPPAPGLPAHAAAGRGGGTDPGAAGATGEPGAAAGGGYGEGYSDNYRGGPAAYAPRAAGAVADEYRRPAEAHCGAEAAEAGRWWAGGYGEGGERVGGGYLEGGVSSLDFERDLDCHLNCPPAHKGARTRRLVAG